MAQAGKYGYIAPGELGGNIHPEEPVFILRARDVLSVFMLTKYIRLARQAGCDAGFLNNLHDIRRDFIEWQQRNHVKVPD